jgi:hypothetical protein
VLTHLGLTEGVDDVQIALAEMITKQGEAAVKRYLGYDPTYATGIIEYHPRVGRPDNRTLADQYGISWRGAASVAGPEVIELGRLPVRSITEVRVDRDGAFGQKSGGFPSTSVLTSGDEYMLDIDYGTYSQTGFLRRQDGRGS